MDELIEAIRTATSAGATDEARAAGANACRAILAALVATPGEPLAQPPPVAPANAVQSPIAAAPPIAAFVSALRGMPPEQLLDLAIERLRAALPKDATVPPVEPVRFQMIPIAPLAATAPTKQENK